VTASIRRLAAVALAATLLVAAPLALTGCSTVEGIIESQTGGDVDLGGDTVPDDFPAEVPLADGDVVNGSAIANGDGEKVWNVLINCSAPAAPDAIAAQLEGAGFTSPGVGGVTEEGGTLSYTKDAFVVNVLLAKTGDSWTANYTVATSGS
jgi:predicted small secreted protein